MNERQVLDRLKLFLTQRRVQAGKNAVLLSFHLHLKDTIEYMEVLHPPKSCGADGLCLVLFIAEHLKEVYQLSAVDEVDIEIKAIAEYINKLAHKETEVLMKQVLGELSDLFNNTVH